MKSIQKKLKSDAKEFKIAPSSIHLRNIMNSIHQQQSTNKSRFSQWLLPVGLTTIALILIVTLTVNNTQIQIKNDIDSQSIPKTASQNVDINLFAINIDNNMTKDIDQEQQAILNDIKHFKSLLAL